MSGDHLIGHMIADHANNQTAVMVDFTTTCHSHGIIHPTAADTEQIKNLMDFLEVAISFIRYHGIPSTPKIIHTSHILPTVSQNATSTLTITGTRQKIHVIKWWWFLEKTYNQNNYIECFD